MKSQEIIIRIKGYKDKIIHPLVLIFDKLGFSAIGITFISAVLGLIAVYFYQNNHYLFITLIFAHLLFDGLDGALARWQKKFSSALGIWLDYFTDRLIVLSLLLKVSFINTFFFWSFILYLIMQILLILFFLQQRTIHNQQIVLLQGFYRYLDPYCFILGAFIFKTTIIILPIIILSYLVIFFNFS
jgi:phosphatidylglycerophosphate synthase